MPNSHGYVKNLQVHKRKQQIGKLERLINGQPKWRTEKLMDKETIEAYADSMASNVPDDPRVMGQLLKWLELQMKANDGEDISLGELETSD